MTDQRPESRWNFRLEAELLRHEIRREALERNAKLGVSLTALRAVRSRELRAAVEAARRSFFRAQATITTRNPCRTDRPEADAVPASVSEAPVVPAIA